MRNSVEPKSILGGSKEIQLNAWSQRSEPDNCESGSPPAFVMVNGEVHQFRHARGMVFRAIYSMAFHL